MHLLMYFLTRDNEGESHRTQKKKDPPLYIPCILFFSLPFPKCSNNGPEAVHSTLFLFVKHGKALDSLLYTSFSLSLFSFLFIVFCFDRQSEFGDGKLESWIL